MDTLSALDLVASGRRLKMKANRCPKCGREPSVIQLTRNPFSMFPKIVGYEAECYDCGLHTERCESYIDAVIKWNELTKGENYGND